VLAVVVEAIAIRVCSSRGLRKTRAAEVRHRPAIIVIGDWDNAEIDADGRPRVAEVNPATGTFAPEAGAPSIERTVAKAPLMVGTSV
jgi:hypothetical protein